MSGCAPHCSPCSNQPAPTDCEPLPSALDNFITAFFGTVQKVVNEDGSVTWTLPCDLGAGLDNNPRLPNEGVACYLLRLISQGLTGLDGPAGPTGLTGATGAAGKDAFSTTSADFVVPSVGGTVSILLVDASWVSIGVNIYVATSGYYLVVGKTGNTLSAQLLDSTGATGTITSGKLVQAAGLKGVKGDDGDPGAPGVGTPGATGATGPGYKATSATSLLTEGTGIKVFTTQAGLAYSVGARVRATSIGTAEWMEGTVTVYSGTTLTVSMEANSGSGTHADWNLNVSGLRGAAGATGATGGVDILVMHVFN